MLITVAFWGVVLGVYAFVVTLVAGYSPGASLLAGFILGNLGSGTVTVLALLRAAHDEEFRPSRLERLARLRLQTVPAFAE